MSGLRFPAFASRLRGLVATCLLLGCPTWAAAQVPITVAWDSNSDGLTSGYLVTVGTSAGAPAATLDAGVATSTVLPLPLGAVYHVAVQAYDAQRTMGAPTPEIIVDLASPPNAPGNISAQVNGSVASLSWEPPATGGIPLGYLLSVGTAPGASNLVSGAPLGNALSISGALPRGTYYARVQAGNMLGVGPATQDVAFEIGARLSAPSGLSASRSGGNAVFTWNPPAGATPAAYVLEAGTRTGASDVGSLVIGAATSFSTQAPPGQYYVRVRALDAAGEASDPSNEAVLPGVNAPGAPKSLASSVSGGVVTLTWRAPTSGGPTSYVLEAGTASGLSNLAVVNVGNVTSFAAPVPPGTFYVRLRAVNAAGAGPASNETVVRR